HVRRGAVAAGERNRRSGDQEVDGRSEEPDRTGSIRRRSTDHEQRRQLARLAGLEFLAACREAGITVHMRGRKSVVLYRPSMLAQIRLFGVGHGVGKRASAEKTLAVSRGA